MGIYSDLSSTNPIAPTGVGLDRSSRQQLQSKVTLHDSLLTAPYLAVNEVTRIPHQSSSGPGDTYILTFDFYGRYKGITFSTEPLAYSVDSSTIQDAINDFAVAVIPGWPVLGDDIIVTHQMAGGISTGWVDFEFTGSVAGVPVIMSMVTIGWKEDGTITRIPGHGDRKALQAMFDLNVVSGTIHNSPDAPTDWVRPASNGQTRPRYQLIRDLALIASIEDGTDEIINTIMALYPVV